MRSLLRFKMANPAQCFSCDTSEYKAATAMAAWEQHEREEEEEERQEVERFAPELQKELEGANDDLEITVSITRNVTGSKVIVGIALQLHSYTT